ncbi:putative bifunctional diguanylate cyclase/phosphodiesterase [Massilia yuzhufengensis]|uniref:PAS domain S-box-containing protein/diguanylate cyclase (GGDEF) domain-containing protein n=1 Tax=Massilia yuzhufengensis TaxID=1164594 RepID=A0A1I1QT73_9BURK|nr:GGDEF domain-containing phosphodiesterase [Massilia yuzhufengensis]SFD25324.1 PAS domain S-box-containing protein/diguanylate cyclase (GGDEF) domain-containing protein [Massilia yuzhufengensis]
MKQFYDLAHWRARIFTKLLSTVLVIGTALAIPSIILVVADGMWHIAVMDVVALGWIFALWWFDRLPYTLRVLNFLAVIFLIGVGLMLSIGAVSQIFLMGPPVLAVVLLGTRQGLASLFLSAATILLLGLGGWAKLYVNGFDDHELLSSLLVTLNFLCVGAIVTLTCGTLLSGLSQTLGEVQGFAESLENKQATLHALNAELRLTSAAVARLNDMVLIARAVDVPGAEQPIIFANDAFERRTGYSRSEIIGRSMRILHGPDTDPGETLRIQQAIARNEPVTAELLNYTRSGEAFWVELEIVPFASEGGRNTHWVAVGRDITERRNSAKAIHNLAFYDVLTGLPNRRLLTERLDALVAARHADGVLGAVLFIDLDNFKHINDARGHATGDALLRHAAERLVATVRGRDTVARLGGDEFVILLNDLGPDSETATAAALKVANKVLAALGEEVRIGEHSYRSTGSIGVALPLRAGVTAHDLLRKADIAMYEAKGSGRNGVALFESSMQADAERKLTLERDLALALENGELAMHLQLQVDHAQAPVGAELLMRWRRADGVLVPPDVFIPIAESSGLIVPLGNWVLRQACAAWHRLAGAGHPMPLSINVSPAQFRQPDFVDQVRAVLQETAAPAGQLIFEVTEGLLVTDLDDTIARMHELAGLGIRFSVDDFGTGYSNLAYLKKMPLYELKIDKSFIRDTPNDVNGTAIVQSILAMADHLGLRVVAEGIETAQQARYLADNGSPCMQGYLFSRPAPLEDLLAALDKTGAARAAA